jgi:hypothetical protein
MALNLDLYIDQGTDWTAILPPVTNPAGTVVDLTTYTAESQLRRSYASVVAVQITATISNPTGGIITLTMVNTSTAGLDPLRYVYDVNITDGSGNITKVFDGLIIVNPGVTNKPNTDLLTPFVPDDYGGLT